MPSRRRFLQLSAAASLAGLSSRVRAELSSATWHGTALGAQSRIVIAGLDDSDAAEVFAALIDEIDRLEAIFSLYRPTSQLSRLNRDQILPAPAADLLTVLSLSRSVWRASDGAFDPSVQTLWASQRPGTQIGSFADLRMDAQSVGLRKHGMALTLNGIAQGYVTDRLTQLLAGFGLSNIAVNAGETRVLGGGKEGTGWRIGIRDTRQRVVARVSGRDRAFATSSPDALQRLGGGTHIFDPRTGQPVTGRRTVSIAAPTAMLADALSTAACCLSADDTRALLSGFDGAALVWRG